MLFGAFFEEIGRGRGPQRQTRRRDLTCVWPLLLALLVACAPASAQDAPRPFLSWSAGVTQYTGDFASRNGTPVGASMAFGIQVTPTWSVLLKERYAAYPGSGQATLPSQKRLGGPTKNDNQRFTLQLLARRQVFHGGEFRGYLDGGAHGTFGEAGPAWGPVLGAGVAVRLSTGADLFVESRHALTMPDDAVDRQGSGIGDVLSQLFAFGVRINL